VSFNACGPGTETPDGGSGGGAGTGGGSALLPDGGVNCQVVALDPKLGTLVLGMGFTVQEAPALGVNVLTVERNGATLFALGTETATSLPVGIFSLGTYPAIVQAAAFQPVVPANEPTGFASNFLTSDGTSLLAGYTKAASAGAVLVFTPGAPTPTKYINAPGNYSATSVSGKFLINALGLGTTAGSGIYALTASTSTGALLATFDSTWQAASGVSAVTSNGIVIAGYYGTATSDSKNHLLAVAPSTYLGPIAGSTSFSLMGSVEVYAGFDVLNAVGFKDGVAVQRGDFLPPTYQAVTSDIVRYPLMLAGSGVQTVTVGAAQTVVSAPNRCTEVDFIGHLGDDLLLGVKDRTGRRLVRVVKP